MEMHFRMHGNAQGRLPVMHGRHEDKGLRAGNAQGQDAKVTCYLHVVVQCPHAAHPRAKAHSRGTIVAIRRIKGLPMRKPSPRKWITEPRKHLVPGRHMCEPQVVVHLVHSEAETLITSEQLAPGPRNGFESKCCASRPAMFAGGMRAGVTRPAARSPLSHTRKRRGAHAQPHEQTARANSAALTSRTFSDMVRFRSCAT